MERSIFDLLGHEARVFQMEMKLHSQPPAAVKRLCLTLGVGR